MTLEEVIAEVKRGLWYPHIDRILKAAASGDLIPASDARRAVASAYQRAGDAMAGQMDMLAEAGVSPEQIGALWHAKTAILAPAPADDLAEVQALRVRASTARWNVDASGRLVRLCRGDHEKSENCSDHEEVFYPEAEVQALRVKVVEFAQIATEREHRIAEEAARAEAAEAEVLALRAREADLWRRIARLESRDGIILVTTTQEHDAALNRTAQGDAE